MSRLTNLLRGTLALAAAVGALPAAAQDCTVTVGRVMPMTGPLAELGRESPWIDQEKIKQANAGGGLLVGGKRCKVVQKIYDSKGTTAGSSEAANRAILSDKVDVLMAQGTPDTTNAPSDLCERYQIPCISSSTPIEAWLLGPDGKPKTYRYTYHFFFGVPDLIKNHIGMINELPGGFNGSIGYLYPNDPDGSIFAMLFDPAFKQAGWKPTDPGRFAQGLPDFSAIINQFKRNKVEVVTGVLAPPDLQNYLQQAAAAGFKPKMYIIDKATGYPEPMKALGNHGDDLLSVNFWSPAFPGSSKFGGYTGQGVVDLYEKANPGRQYSPMMAYSDAMYDVLFDALQRAGSTDRAALLKALGETNLDTVVGRVKFNEQHFSVQPLGGAQWQSDKRSSKLVKQNVYNAVYPEVKKTADMRLYQNSLQGSPPALPGG